ncbi:hypothetical protein HAX54_047844, partial [Datura stramonium]|nr:hypothetical protein [Datura stramonium]
NRRDGVLLLPSPVVERKREEVRRLGLVSPVGRREGEKRKGWRRRETVAGICMVSSGGDRRRRGEE